MKFLFISLCLTLTTVAAAAEKRIELHRAHSGNYGSYSGRFAINMELGRAWIEYSGIGKAAESSDDEFRTLVPGLVYDRANLQVIYQNDGYQVICANVRERISILKPTIVRPTGKCRFEERTVKVNVDNGFEIKRRTYDVFDLVIEE